MREASKSKDTFIASEFDLSGGKPTLVKVHSKELHDLAAKYSSLIAESFFLQNVRGTYSDFDSYLRKAHSALLAFLKSKTLDPEDPNLLLRALYNGRVPHNSPFKPTPVVRDKKENTKGPPPSAAAGAASQTSQQLQQHPQLPKPPEINHPKKYTEKLKAEASVVQRISELQKEGMWYDRRLPRNHEPSRIKAHWDYLLEEMTWLATDFASERKWKRNASKRCAKMIDKYFNDREIERLRAEKEEEIRLRRIASFIAKEIKNFWSNAQQIVEYKEQSRIEEMKKKALDQQLSYIVDQTEKYSSMLAESFVGDSSIISNATDTHDTTGGDTTCGPHSLETPSDDEFEPAQESEDDDEETIAKEEEENEEGENELYDLERNGQMSLDDLLDDLPPGYLEELTSKIDKVNETEPPASETDKPPPSPAGSDKNEIAKTLVRGEKPPSEVLPTPEENEVEGTDCTKVSDEAAIAEPVIEELDASVEGVAADSASEFESEVDESESETAEEDPSTETEDSDILTDAEEDEPEDEEQTVGLASLLQTFAPERAGELHEEDAALNSVAAMAESFQPKGYTLSSQTVNTKVPSLLHHTLREYQLIGLDWLVTMHEKKLNGILADEMGLGKTIQTIALLAHLACEKGNWGPHLIVVPTSVMLNWEMEFKKWCPGFKILTYYGSIKERRLKRTGWTKPNAFHICITSYKLVIQDHGSFRRKRWKYLILDEAQNIKNFKSQRWQLLLNFSTHRRLLLTGTPLQNNLMELWSLMHFLMPNVFQSHREFREWFSNPVSGMVEGNSEYNENIIRRLHKVLRPFILRRLKSEVEKQLPKKHEHVVMCRLSKRQRFLYEDFMSRSKTKETLATGNLLSVINVLMQLRKVCNHPNLFESRPVISPLLSVGITYLIPSIVWNLYENLVKDTTHPLFGMSKSDLLYTKSQSERILNLKPPGEDNYSPNTLSSPDSYFSSCGSLKRKHPDQEEDITEYDYILQTTVVSTLPDGSIKCAPKRRKFLKWCADVALPAPRTKAPIPFFLMNVDPTPYLDDINFVEAVGESAPKPFYLKVVSQPSETERQQIPNNDNHLLPAEAAFQNNVIPEVPSPTLSSPETQRCKPKSYQDDEDLSESDSLDEEEDEREDNEYEEDSFEEDSDDISESYSDDIDDEGPSRKRRKRTLAPKGDFKRLRRMSLMKKDEDKSKDSNSMEEIADSTEIDDTASEDYNLDKRNKVNCGMRKSYSGAQWAKAMGYSPSEFQETDVQARSIRNRRALIDRLKFVNDQRCEVLPVFGFDALDQCRILGSLPVMRYYGTRCRHLKIPYRGRSIKRDYINNGYFLQGYEEVYSISQVKNSQSAYIRNHPLLIWRHTKALMSAVWSLEEVLEEFSPILKRFIIYVPAVSSPLLTSRIFRPSPSLYAQQFNVEEELREVLRQPSAILHPIISSMSTQFPDPRLIQYDCGKLQILDTLLRRLKSESHRVLIFTQMAKMLDVLEAFLNYHGHIYLRLDGATRIDQRQILMEKFNSDKRIFCFILSTRSGGIGINLTGADTVIFYDSDWNPTMDAQAQDRCHRIGQTRDVHIYRLVSEKTIEENILKKSNQKRLLGELAIEGGNFTTAFFQKHSIYELFDVQTNENDAMKRLTEKSEESEKTLEIHDVEIDETDKKVGVVPDTVDKNQMQIFESALAAAEDETDVQATRTVKAEAAAELAEFDESIPLEDLGDGQDIVEKSMIDTEMESIMAELSKVEIYALKFMESTIDDWSRETVAQAQKELEQQKREWEMEQIRQLEARNKMGTDYSDEEDMLTYSATDAQNQVWISQGGGEHFMPLWAPPTPPSDDSDVYVDNCHGFLYDYDLIPESNLPPVYQPPKKDKKPVVIPVPNVKQSIIPVPVLTNLPDEEVVTPLNSTIEKKSPKVPRRDEPIFAPRSLFDRPSPAMAKLRRDYRLQKYNCRPVVTAALNKSSLGPGAITFPIVHPTSTKAPSPPPQHESVEWMIAEDHALLQTIQTILEMPLSLLVVNLAQTPNWDLAAEMVNLTSKIHRTPKQCKIRYETIVGPREEGKLFYEQPPAAKNKKKSKSFIKVGPPSPSRTGRIVKMSQLITADNNSQLLNTYVAKFDLVKNVAMKRPLTKPMTLNPHMKTNKQAATIFAEHGINLESPISATAIAQARYERLQLERKKLYAAQQAAVAAAGTIQSPHPVTTAALNAAAALAAEGNRISAATAVTIPLTTVGATSVIAGPIVSNAVIVPSSVGINVSPGTATVVTATASEVHKAKIAAQAAHASDLPVIRFTHPASATTLQEMIQRRSPGTTSNNPIISKRQHVLSQQQNQLQQQLQSLQQSQMTHKNPKISLQFAQVAQKPSLATTTLQQTGGVQQIQVSSAQQVVIGQPSSNLAKAQPGSNLNTSVQLQGQRQVMMQGSGQMVTQQAQSSVLSQPSIQLQQKQVVMAYQQAVSQASQQQKQQQIQIQLPQSPTVQTGTIQQATVPAQSIHVSSPQSVIINQPTSIATSITPNSPITTSIQLQGQKQIVMTGSGQAQILTQQQQQISQSTIQLQGQKQVVMAYQTGSQGQIIQKQSPQITQQLQQSQQQQQQQTQVHVHLHTPSSQGTGVTLGHQTQTVVLPQGLAQALVSSAANLTPTLNLMTTTSPVLTTMTSSGVTTSGVVTPGSVSIPRTQQVGSHTAQQGRTVTMQLVKQHTVGGKTVTRTVSDSEIAAFLKQHGLTPSTRVAIAGQPGTQAQIGQLTGTKGQQVAQVQVPAAQIITSMGLQKLGYQISPGGGGAQVATVLKTPASQASSAQGASLAFPLSFSQVRNVSQKTGTHNLNKQPTQISTFQQQILSQQRRQTQQQQQTASKLAHIAQVSSSQGSVPQLIVQATPKQIQNTINVQHIQHVLKPSQVIQGQSGVLQAQLLAHKTMSRMVTSSASAAAVSSGTVSGVSPTMVTVSSNSGSGLPTAVTIPTSLVAAPSGQGGIIRISQQNQSIKPGSIQMITAQTASLLNQQQSLARPYAQGQNISTLNVTSGAVGNQSLPIRLQGSTSNVLPSPATLTNVSGAGVIVSETGNVITSVAEVTSPATKIILTEEAVKSSSSDTNANPTDNAV